MYKEITQSTFDNAVALGNRIYDITTKLENDNLTLAKKLALRREREQLIVERERLIHGDLK